MLGLPVQREQRPVASHCPGQFKVCGTKGIRRKDGRCVVVAEEDVHLEPVSHLVQDYRIYFVTEEVEVHRRFRPFYQASDPARFADILRVPDRGRKRVFRRCEVGDRVSRQDCGRIRAEFRLDCGDELIDGHAPGEAPIDERPALVPVRAEQDWNMTGDAELEQLTRLGWDVDSVDDRRPLRTARSPTLARRRSPACANRT